MAAKTLAVLRSRERAPLRTRRMRLIYRSMIVQIDPYLRTGTFQSMVSLHRPKLTPERPAFCNERTDRIDFVGRKELSVLREELPLTASSLPIRVAKGGSSH